MAKPTILDNARFLSRPEAVPVYAVTMGVGTILEARSILLLAQGASKAAAVAAAVEGPVTSMVTASALQLHRDVTCYLDRHASAQLRMVEYYEWIDQKGSSAPPSVPRPHYLDARKFQRRP